ncbi:putative formaldehyde dehydrogenase AdhA [Cladobotryum mycophilum]|uniref:Formaldehyde dehydrogenase AdhA n=1 Tax=Cladobotryum mycophilum TaxID=491253 RepID=A0ABR0T0V5_9HYPO
MDACLGRDGPRNPCDDHKPNRAFAYTRGTVTSTMRMVDTPFTTAVRIISWSRSRRPGAGLTACTLLRHYGAGPGKNIGIVSVGGEGHFAVLFAKAMGSDEVVVKSRTASKRNDDLNLDTDEYIATSKDKTGLRRITKSIPLDPVVLPTFANPSEMPYGDYLGMLKYNGTLVQIGIPEATVLSFPGSLILDNKKIAGVTARNPEKIEEMLQLAADKEIKPLGGAVHPMSDANQAVLSRSGGRQSTAPITC